MTFQERRKWFLDRVGKTVFRNDNCECEKCQRIYEEGLVIANEQHAIYLHDCEADTDIQYFDTREEVLAYEGME